jgi:hypothetical protein
MADAQHNIFRRCIWLVLEFVSIVFWIYVICKLFIFDIDIYLVSRIEPQLAWVIDYKFFILTGLILASVLLFDKKYIIPQE